MNTIEAQLNQAQTEPAALIGQISVLLEQAGHQDPLAWVSEMHADNPAAINATDPKMERFMINSYWRNRLGDHDVNHGTNTTHERFALIDEGGMMDWLRLFNDMVVPCILKHHL